MFAIIVINLFVAVILNGYDKSSLFEGANLSEFHCKHHQMAWGKFDKNASGVIKCSDFIKFLAQITLPFEREDIYENIS